MATIALFTSGRLVNFCKRGKQGIEPGEFDLPHSIAIDRAGKVYVADGGNSRRQIFDQGGNLLAIWPRAQVGRPWAVRVDGAGPVYVVDGGDQRSFCPIAPAF